MRKIHTQQSKYTEGKNAPLPSSGYCIFWGIKHLPRIGFKMSRARKNIEESKTWNGICQTRKVVHLTVEIYWFLVKSFVPLICWQSGNVCEIWRHTRDTWAECQCLGGFVEGCHLYLESSLEKKIKVFYKKKNTEQKLNLQQMLHIFHLNFLLAFDVPNDSVQNPDNTHCQC